MALETQFDVTPVDIMAIANYYVQLHMNETGQFVSLEDAKHDIEKTIRVLKAMAQVLGDRI